MKPEAFQQERESQSESKLHTVAPGESPIKKNSLSETMYSTSLTSNHSLKEGQSKKMVASPFLSDPNAFGNTELAQEEESSKSSIVVLSDTPSPELTPIASTKISKPSLSALTTSSKSTSPVSSPFTSISSDAHSPTSSSSITPTTTPQRTLDLEPSDSSYVPFFDTSILSGSSSQQRKKRRIRPTFIGPLSGIPPSSVASSTFESEPFNSPNLNELYSLLPSTYLTTSVSETCLPVPASFPFDIFENLRSTFLPTLLTFTSESPKDPTAWMTTAHVIYDFIYQHQLPHWLHQVVFGSVEGGSMANVWVAVDSYLLQYQVQLSSIHHPEHHRYMLAVAKHRRLGNFQKFKYIKKKGNVFTTYFT
ncbi:hypothetical protein HMI56_002480 [Coelomomyces lativittatus]|nr:hypothetical protein HMI56_002480 [Coelomomyces lativittatus]